MFLNVGINIVLSINCSYYKENRHFLHMSNRLKCHAGLKTKMLSTCFTVLLSESVSIYLLRFYI